LDVIESLLPRGGVDLHTDWIRISKAGQPVKVVPETTFVGSAVPTIDHVALVNGVPLRVPVISPPVAVYVSVEALAAIGVARMQAAIANMNRSLKRGRFIEKYPL
jgi:hypothetical protein